MSLAQQFPLKVAQAGYLKLVDRLNGPWHKTALRVYMLIVLAHWVEHVLQALQVYLIGWPRSHAHGAIGLVLPRLDSSEWLHYGYALVMLIGLIILRPGFVGQARMWWTVALVIQVWHHFEHALLLLQVQLHFTLFGSPTPISVLQLFVPRMELHLFYNAVVFVPMVIAVWLHIHPTPADSQRLRCTCGVRWQQLILSEE